MGLKSQLTGKRFGRLVVLSDSGRRSRKKDVIWDCLCDCGTTIQTCSVYLNCGDTKSCGCLQKDIVRTRSYKHGDTPRGNISRLWITWKAMKVRCYNPNDRAYVTYGQRGITVCNEWKNNYSTFREWALSNKYRDGLTIDRIDNDGNYEPTNCQFLSRGDNIKKELPQKTRDILGRFA